MRLVMLLGIVVLTGCTDSKSQARKDVFMEFYRLSEAGDTAAVESLLVRCDGIIAQDCDDINSYGLKTRVLKYLGRYDESINVMDIYYARLSDDDPEKIFWAGLKMDIKGDTATAYLYYQQAIEREYEIMTIAPSAERYDRIAITYVLIGDNAAAYDVVRNGHARYPANANLTAYNSDFYGFYLGCFRWEDYKRAFQGENYRPPRPYIAPDPNGTEAGIVEILE